MTPSHIKEGNQFYSKSIDLMLISSTETKKKHIYKNTQNHAWHIKLSDFVINAFTHWFHLLE